MNRIAATFMLLLLIACAHDSTPPATVAVTAATPGEVRGHVTTGRNPLPGATVTLTGNGFNRTAVTDVNGAYTFVNVPLGRYTISAQLSGFTTTARRVALPAAAIAQVDLDIRVAAVAESITVTASAPMVMNSAAMSTVYSTSVSAEYGRFPTTGYIEDAVTERYAAIKESDFVAAAKQSVTTFSIDVDRASYANVRRYLKSNTLPPPDAVRIEEMVNYFTYHYPAPTDGRPFAVSTEVAGCPWEPTHRLLRIGIQGKQIEQWRQAPNNLVFLLDVSGSMQPPNRLPMIKSALRLLVDQLRAEDSVAVVVYAGAAGLVLPPTSGADKQKILDAIDNLQAGGSTAGGAGIELAYKTAQDHFNAQGNNRVILATDGDFNVGVNDTTALGKLIEEKRATGVFLTCIGVGEANLNDELMKTLSMKGNGNYAYLDSIDEAKKVFVHEIGGTLVAIAKDVKVQLEFDPSVVSSYRQIGYELRALSNADFHDDAKDAGELGAGHSVTALYELVPARNAVGRIATLRLRYKEPKSSTSQLLETAIEDGGTSAYAASADTQFAAAVAELGMLLRNSKHKGNATYADALALARASRGEDLDGYREELLRMVETSKALSGEGGKVAAKE